MADQRVDAMKTLVTAPVFARAVIDAWWAVSDVSLSDTPPKAAVGVLYAHYMLETGGLNCYGWNIGNVKYTLGCGYDYHCLRGVNEGVTPAEAQRLINSGEASPDPSASRQAACAPNVSVLFNPPHPTTRFIAYPTLSDAMDEHLLLLCKKRYAGAWPAVLSGSVPGFVHALKAKGYMTSSADAYNHGMLPSFTHFMASQEFEAALRASQQDVTEPVYEDSGDVVHAMVDFPPYWST